MLKWCKKINNGSDVQPHFTHFSNKKKKEEKEKSLIKLHQRNLLSFFLLIIKLKVEKNYIYKLYTHLAWFNDFPELIVYVYAFVIKRTQ